MTNKEKLIAKLGLDTAQFEAKKNETTIDDVVEALNVLAEIVLAESEDE